MYLIVCSISLFVTALLHFWGLPSTNLLTHVTIGSMVGITFLLIVAYTPGSKQQTSKTKG